MSHFDAETALELAHGLLTDEEAERLLVHARGCRRCDRILLEAAADRHRFRSRREVLLEEGLTPVASRRSGRVRLIGAMLAAAALLVVAIVALRNPAASPDPSLLGLPDRPDLVRLRAPDEESDLARLEEAIAHYESGKQERTAQLLRIPFSSARFESLRHLYRSSALLAVGKEDAARASLDSAETRALPVAYREWHTWAELHLSSDPGARSQRDSLVRALAARPGPLQAKASALLAADGSHP